MPGLSRWASLAHIAMLSLHMALLCTFVFFMLRVRSPQSITSSLQVLMASHGHPTRGRSNIRSATSKPVPDQRRTSIDTTWRYTGNKSTKHTDEKGCTVCSGIDGLIIFDHSAGGLKGNRAMIKGLGYLARHVCAQVALLAPCKALDNKHTIKENEVDCNLSWDHFFNITTSDGTNLIRTRTLHHANEIKSNTSPQDGLNEALRARDFVWHLRIGQQQKLGIRLRELNYFRGAYEHCSYVQIQAPSWIKSAADDILIPMGLHRNDFDSLHIRRTDSIQTCNSSVEAVLSLVDCARQVRSEKMLVFTDERSQWYHQEVVVALKTTGVSAIFMDPIIERRTTNNYDTFQIGQVIQGSAKTRFEIHRCKRHPGEQMIRMPESFPMESRSSVRTCVTGWKRTYLGT